MSNTELQEVVRDGIVRGLGIVGLAGIALIHLLDAPGQFGKTPYLGWMDVGLIVGCIALAAALVRDGPPRAWAAAGALSLSVMLGYTLSRTTVPGATGDIGNRSELLGIASLFVEVAVSAFALRTFVPDARLRAATEVRS